jgi:YD repeat-containing protein
VIVKYFEDADTLYVQFSDREVAETKDLDENTTLEYDKSGRVVGMTLEHAKKFAEVSDFSFEHILPKSA